jgi:hypothetical protein
MSRLSRRLRTVEAKLPAPPQVFTQEELHVAKMVLAGAIGRSRHSEELRERGRTTADKLKAEIVATAKRHDTEQFQRHISGYVQPTWQTRWGRPEYLPPIVGSEYDDWELPDLYRRRLAIRHLPAVIELIGSPETAWGSLTPRNVRLDLLFLHLIEKAAARSTRA